MYEIGNMYDIGGDLVLGEEDDIDMLLSGYDDDDIIGAVLARRGGAASRYQASRAPAVRAASRAPARAPSRSAMSPAVMRQSALTQAVANRQVNNGALVNQHAFTKARNWPLPFDTVTTVAAGATVNITSNPQMPFKPTRLVIGNSIASSFLVNNIIIGQQPQFAALNAAGPADAFAPTSFGIELDCDTAQPNTNVILQVTNASLAALRFNAFLFGTAVL